MKKLKLYIKLMRPKHYIKNLLIAAALVFSGGLTNIDRILTVIIGFCSFSLLCSAVYIINDINDVENDRKDERKRKRPIASGDISVKNSAILAVFCVIGGGITDLVNSGRLSSIIILITYFALNVLYSKGAKNIPILDVVILVSGFLLRVIYGACIIDEVVSNWMYLTVMAMSFYLGLGKRRNEFRQSNVDNIRRRTVLELYNEAFLDKMMYMSLSLAMVFYSLWCVDVNTMTTEARQYLIWTVPLVLIICMKYSLNVEMSPHGDPVDILTGDKTLLALLGLFGITIIILLYMN